MRLLAQQRGSCFAAVAGRRQTPDRPTERAYHPLGRLTRSLVVGHTPPAPTPTPARTGSVALALSAHNEIFASPSSAASSLGAGANR